ncbi:MAG: hypothetical protein KAY50_00635 [Chitinophagaceae bacterium]|nr:hypothetical protein [Chitinophagaceae bacterium]
MTKMEFISFTLLYLATIITLFVSLAKEKKAKNLVHEANVLLLKKLDDGAKKTGDMVSKMYLMVSVFEEIGLLEISTTMTNRQFELPEAKTQAIPALVKQITDKQVNYHKEQIPGPDEMSYEDSLCKVTASIGIIPKFSKEKVEKLKSIFELKTEQHNYYHENSTN